MDEILTKLVERRDSLVKEGTALIDRAKAENRNFNASELVEHSSVTEDLKILNDRISELQEDDRRNQRAAQAQKGFGIKVNREESVYRPDGNASYFKDLIQQRAGDHDASDRLRRHKTEIETRDISRVDGAGGEFVPPLWLMDRYTTVARAGRVTADRMQRLALPAGTDSVNIPTLATGAAVAIQSADNAAVQETDPTTSSAAAPVRTLAGQVDVSVQALEQSPAGFDQIIFQDLVADYASKLDTQVISGSGASGQVTGLRNQAGIITVTYTDASPTLPELYKKIADAISQMATNRFLPPTSIVLHPRRWAWALSELDTTNRPLVVPTAIAQNASATAGDFDAGGAVGTLLGLPVYIDANIPTNVGGGTEDIVLIVRGEDHLLLESSIRTRTLPDVGSGTLTTRLQVYGFVAFTAGRYAKSTAIVTGTGLTAPTFA